MTPGTKVLHTELGEGVVVALEASGFVRVYFRTAGERTVPPQSLRTASGWLEQVVRGMRPAAAEATELLSLAIEAAELPLMESAATLTSAKVDLLPHQVVLVHRIASASPRRFLIADEVGLGKTIETALILRELASRGEMERALMVVPAGLVSNWQRELNEVFNLDFEVFGSEGDVTDRKSNAFEKHHRLIISIDTLKRPRRVEKLLAAPKWDLVVFDEAHHLSAYRSGKKVKRTENFDLAEELRAHCRDLLLLSATPHQGDHFRFWMLVRLLQPELFEDEREMVEQRHRLNAVVIRRSKADACASDGGPLFARRMVHTEGFDLSPTEKAFYDSLNNYLRDGYDLAKKQGSKGRALGFVMTIFQKIAASSFAAVRATLRRRLLMLTVQDALERNAELDVLRRDQLLAEATEMLIDIHGLSRDRVGYSQAEVFLAEAKHKLIQKQEKSERYLESAESYGDSEIASVDAAESAETLVQHALPEERSRIRQLLESFPPEQETKTRALIQALRVIWGVTPKEKIVVFATYLASVDSLREAIDREHPGKGVEVLKGGDHSAKLTAQKRFKLSDGPCVLICTAAGREGINLQFARVLFNYDLPWNPMDLEQRIGRIHRYGQKDTAQVYNLVARDTIEGQIFTLLEEKLEAIAKALGKVDEKGQIAEDFRSQILGQIGAALRYDQLYKNALADPSLVRTRQELEVAMDNATKAREVVFELFQDLERFNLGDYQRFDDDGRGMARLVGFASRSAQALGQSFRQTGPDIYELSGPQLPSVQFTTNRDRAMESVTLQLLGLEHPVVKTWRDRFAALPADQRAIVGTIETDLTTPGLLTVWQVLIQGKGGQQRQKIVRLGLTSSGERSLALERTIAKGALQLRPSGGGQIETGEVLRAVTGVESGLLHRELAFSGALDDDAVYTAPLLALFVYLPVASSDGAPALDELPASYPEPVRETYRKAVVMRRELERQGWTQSDFADELRRMLLGENPK